MIDKYEEIFDRFKTFIENDSKYNARVVKYNTNTSTYFPLIVCTLSDNQDTDFCTNDKIEYYESFYFTIDIYTKNINQANKIVAAQEITNYLSKMTMMFFGEKMNMKKTLNRPTPNIDKEIYRQTIQYQCLIGNVRGNIIRR